MKERCSNKSAGTIVRKDGKILLIERMKVPFGFAAPAGHVDEGEDYETCAKRELSEETGLNVIDIAFLIEGRQEGTCHRGGTWHYWKVYRAEVKGQERREAKEAKQMGWYSIEEIRKLADKTRKYTAGEITESDWQKSPGLEIAWFDWFTKLGII